MGWASIALAYHFNRPDRSALACEPPSRTSALFRFIHKVEFDGSHLGRDARFGSPLRPVEPLGQQQKARCLDVDAEWEVRLCRL